jgi:hypothetical protein
VSEWLDVSVGYDFLYWSNVIRPGDQVSGTINSGQAPSQVPYANGGPIAPVPTFRRTDFSAQGLLCTGPTSRALQSGAARGRSRRSGMGSR